MRLFRSLAGWGLVAIVAVVAAALLSPGSAHAAASHAHGLLEPGAMALPWIGAFGMIRIWGQPLDAGGLQRLASPERGDLETYPEIKYDRQTFPQAGGVASLAFFTAVAGVNVTNMEAAGQFPAPQWFQPFSFMVTPMAAGPSNITAPASGTNATGIANDWDLLCKTQGMVLELSIAKKVYGPWPVLALHGTGGAMGALTGSGAGALVDQAVQNGPADGGFGPQGEIVIPPNVGFTVRLILTAAQALSVATLVEVAILGRLYRAPR